MSTLKIDTQDGRRNFLPGETVALTCAWQLEQAPRAVEVRLFWYTRGKGDRDVSVVETERFDAPAAMDLKRLEFTLPNGPYSFSGKLVALLWAVELVVEPSGESQRIELTVSPSGEEVLLHGVASDLVDESTDRKKGWKIKFSSR